jgi:hypothetical protein
MMSSTHELWSRIHDATPPGWFVGRPACEPHKAVPWSQYAFDTTERPKVGHRSREWTAVGMTEELVLEQMAKCLGEIRERRVPR